MNEILDIQDLHTYFYTYGGVVKALNGINLKIREKETVGLVGETGCGKSVTALSILRLIQYPGRIVQGKILFKGENLVSQSESEIQRIRGNRISMIFQEPMSALNPVLTIGDQISSVIKLHQNMSKGKARQETLQVLQEVRIPDATKVVRQYPHQLSGGMRQRVMIAMALACKPELLIADEPTTYLDTTIQAQVLRLMKDLKDQLGVSMILITHNLGIVAQTCDRVAIMYAGNIVEMAPVKEIFENPKHPYVSGLLRSIPSVTKHSDRLEVIVGSVPNLVNPPGGCRFHPRCPKVMPTCSRELPQMTRITNDHTVSCYLYE